MKLEPCPFCGSEGRIEDDTDHHGRFVNIGCSDTKCGAWWFINCEIIDDNSELDELIKKWNRRTKK